MNLLLLTSFVVLLAAAAHAKKRRVRRLLPLECEEPEDLKNHLADWHREAAQAEAEAPIVDPTDEWTPLTEEAEICDQNPATDPASTVMQRSLCPWSYKSSFDEHREPKTLTEAFCLCRKSRGSLGAYCLPIRRPMPILRRAKCDPRTATFTYERSVQWITVGCHSVLPRSQRALPLFKHYKREDSVET
ncbi:hypothetical protein M3Y99_00894200 [Aphelenchoides fujianensis]|nr:hypothetical protein M3Y99_00894200 [Aphelenchoides fujianensis]